MKRRTMMTSLVALLVVSGPAVADELETMKTSNAAFSDLSSLAGQGRQDLGLRRGGTPEVVEEVTSGPRQLTATQVQRVVGERQPEIEYCYAKHMRGVSSPSGEVAVSFVISTKGTVSSIAVQVDGPTGKGLEKCIVQRVKKWRFPAATAPTEVAIPFLFSQAGE